MSAWRLLRRIQQRPSRPRLNVVAPDETLRKTRRKWVSCPSVAPPMFRSVQDPRRRLKSLAQDRLPREAESMQRAGRILVIMERPCGRSAAPAKPNASSKAASNSAPAPRAPSPWRGSSASAPWLRDVQRRGGLLYRQLLSARSMKTVRKASGRRSILDSSRRRTSVRSAARSGSSRAVRRGRSPPPPRAFAQAAERLVGDDTHEPSRSLASPRKFAIARKAAR